MAAVTIRIIDVDNMQSPARVTLNGDITLVGLDANGVRVPFTHANIRVVAPSGTDVLDRLGRYGTLAIAADGTWVYEFDGLTFSGALVTTIADRVTYQGNYWPYFPDSYTSDDYTGNDFLYGTDNDNWLWSGGGNDVLYGGAGNDQLEGAGGNDVLIGGGGHDILYGGADNDRLYGNEGVDRLYGDGGHDVLQGGAGVDTLYGGEGHDRLDGGEGHDTLYGGPGNDLLVGGSGQDYLVGGTGTDIIEGGEGQDTAYWDGAEGGVKVNLGDTVRWKFDAPSSRWISGTTADYTHIRAWIDTNHNGLLDATDEFDYLQSIETLAVSGGNNILTGDAQNNHFWLGGPGLNIIDGGAGYDTVQFVALGRARVNLADPTKWKFDAATQKWVSGRSAEYTYIRAEIDWNGDGYINPATDYSYLINIESLIGTSRQDILKGDAGANFLDGQVGDDRLYGGDGDDVLYGGADWDYLYGDGGRDILYGNEGRDYLYGGEGQDDLYGGIGNDFLSGDAGIDRLYGGEGRDIIYGGGNHDLLYGGDDNDQLYGDDGNDFLYGGEGYDRLYGGAGNDELNGEEGDDKLYGGAGDDILRGLTGIDRLSGGDDDDYLYGGEGDDWLYGGAGNDYLYGNEDIDRLRGDEGRDYLSGGEGDDYLYGNAGNDLLYGGDGADWLYGDEDNDRLYGDDGNDVLRGGIGDDRLGGGDGDDELYGEKGDDELHGGYGDDRLFGGDNNDRLHGGYNNDFLSGGTGRDFLSGGTGTDTLNGGAGNDELHGGAGNDILSGDGNNDRLFGDSGNDWLWGGAYHDELTGGTGRDILFGGTGNDIFVLYQGAHAEGSDNLDIVKDFGVGQSKIRVATATGSETTIEALKTAANLRWTTNTNEGGDADRLDTVIWDTRGTADTSDDIKLMILEDYTGELNMRNFDIVRATPTLPPPTPPTTPSPAPTTAIDAVPTVMRLSTTSASVDEGTATARKLADISFTDDGRGTNEVTIPTSSIFEIRNGNELWLKAGATFDYETARSHSILLTPSVTGDGTPPPSQTFTLNIVDIDDAPTAMTLSATSASVNEGTATARKLADISFTDDGRGTNEVTIPENNIFEIRNGNELWLKAGATFDYTIAQSYNIILTPSVTGTGTPPPPLTFTLNVADGDNAPTAMRLSATSASVNEGTATARKLADISFTDDGRGTNTVTIPESEIFEIRNGNELWLKAGATFDHATAQSHSITLTPSVTGAGTPPPAQTFTLNVGDVDNAPILIILTINQMPVNEGVAEARKLAEVSFIDDGLGTNIMTIPDSDIFEIRNGRELWLKEGAVLDYETARSHSIRFTISVTGTGALAPFTGVYTLTVRDMEEFAIRTVVVDGQLHTREDSSLLVSAGQMSVETPWPVGTRYTLHVNDVRINSAGSFVAGQYGWLAVNQDGSWQYLLDDSNMAVEALHGRVGEAGNRLTETFTVTFTHTNGETVTRSFTITIEGRTDHYMATDARTLDFRTSTENLALHSHNEAGEKDLYGGAGHDVLNGGSATDTLHGGGGHDVLNGWGYHDRLYGGEGNDVLQGGSGNDYLNGGPGNDLLDGGTGTQDAASWADTSREVNVKVNLGDTVKWKFDTHSRTWISGTTADFTFIRAWIDLDRDGLLEETDEFDYLVNIEQLYGSSGDDTFIGSSRHEVFYDEFGGSDRFDGGGGQDMVVWKGVTGSIFANLATDIKWKYVADTNSWVSGTGAGYDYIRVSINRDVATGIPEYDYLKSIERLSGGSGSDTLTGDDGANHLLGQGGRDILVGGAENDWLDGGSGNDVLEGGTGVDMLQGGRGNDIFVLYQGAHAEGAINLDLVLDFSLQGQDKIRVATATGSETTLAALQAAANLRWTTNTDESGLTGDSSNLPHVNDLVIWDTRGTADTADDIMLMILQDYTEDLTIENFDIVRTPAPAPLVVDAVPTAMTVATIRSSVREGATGLAIKVAEVYFTDDGIGTNGITIPDSDIFEVRNGNELWLKAGAILDYETARSHSITLTPSVTGTGTPPPAQTFTLSVLNVEELRGDASHDWLRGTYGDDLIYGEGGHDHLWGEQGHDLLYGGAGNDYLYGNAGDDHLYGGAGNDQLYGGAGNNLLYGGAGNDVLLSGRWGGDDWLYGGTGDDIFVLHRDGAYYAGYTPAVVKDFGVGEDKIRISTATGSETTLAALKAATNLRWTTDTNEGGTDRLDTVILDTRGTADTSDDVKLMILEDYTFDLTIVDFDIV